MELKRKMSLGLKCYQLNNVKSKDYDWRGHERVQT
jgi:hypothetical protein